MDKACVSDCLDWCSFQQAVSVPHILHFTFVFVVYFLYYVIHIGFVTKILMTGS